VSYDPGAFDKCLTRVRNRKRRINLCIGHQTDTVYASTADQSLRVWMEGPELRFRVLPVTSRSRSLIARIHRDDDLRQVSIGCRFLYATKDPYLDDPAGTPDDPIIASIVEVDVYEISLVTRGANPRTWVRFE
jgi:HK97 family phage prohead protease